MKLMEDWFYSFTFIEMKYFECFGFKGYWEKVRLDDKWELNDEIK